MIRWFIGAAISLLLIVQPIFLGQPVLSADPPAGPSLFEPKLGYEELRGGLPASRFDDGGIVDLVIEVLNVVSYIIAFLAMAGLIISGIMYITAAGDPDKAKRARSNIVWIIIGMVIYILAYWLLQTTRLFADCLVDAYQVSLIQQLMMFVNPGSAPC